VDPLPPPAAPAPARRRHDWRFWVGGLGRVLVALGVLILGFVAYQLWGTGIQAARAQDSLEREFEQSLGSTVPPTTAPSTSAPPTTTPPSTLPGETTVATTAPPTTPPTTTAPPSRPEYEPGDAVALLEIPRIGVEWYVVSGVRTSDLKRGPGHYPSTPLPGEEGNSGIAGHRTTYGAPFADLDDLDPGDEVIVTTYGGRFVYRVAETVIVQPTNTEVLAPTADTRLTLTTCHPRYSTAQRLIVTAVLDPDASPVPLPPPATGPITVPPVDLTTGQTVATTAPGEGPDGTLAPAATTTTTTTVDADADAADDADATLADATDELSRGWFSDPDAWPHVAAWGFALIGVSLAAWGISRATGRNWVGALVGIVPFVVVVYFFYENVARLLPPNL